MTKLIAFSFKNLRTQEKQKRTFSHPKFKLVILLFPSKTNFYSKSKNSDLFIPPRSSPQGYTSLQNWCCPIEDGQLFARVDKSSKLLLTSWYVVFGDGQLVTSQWRQLNIAENRLPWKQSFAGGERKQQGCGSWARGPPAAAPVYPGTPVHKLQTFDKNYSMIFCSRRQWTQLQPRSTTPPPMCPGLPANSLRRSRYWEKQNCRVIFFGGGLIFRLCTN